MMASLTGRTRGGTNGTRTFVSCLDPKKCIGCGRCYKVCPRDVLDLVERSEQLLAEADDDADDDDEMMVMTIVNAGDCIGCGACGRVCPKDCYTYEAAGG
jgi:Nif-specific ferredoxin III